LNNPDLCKIVEPDLREEFMAMPIDELWQLEHKYDALIDDCYGPGKFSLRSHMDALVILNWKRDAGEMKVAMVDPKERKDLLPAFMKATGLFYLPSNSDRQGDHDVEAYSAMLTKADLIEISGGVDFDKAADVCLYYMENGELPA
jgi:HprK-related kinase B